jgi:hypothetical protein
MIIGAILDVGQSGTGPGASVVNGAALVTFYTMADAVIWAQLQSENFQSGTNPNNLIPTTSVINTDTGERRWWFNGTEYTG